MTATGIAIWHQTTTNGSEDYLWRHLLEQDRYQLMRYEQNPYERGNMETVARNLDVYFITSKLRSFIDIQSRQIAQKTTYDLKTGG
ncbi:MAG: hypothetical protein HC821_03815 [Lewinella sp.]|nr:hypothetical protein [Lewinella sp.]